MRILRTLQILGAVLAAIGIAAVQSPTAEPRSAGGSSNAVAAELALITSAAGSRATAVMAPTAPAPVADEIVELRVELDRLIRNLSTRNSNHGVLVVSLDRGDTIYAYNPDLPLAPASNMKLFSTAAALYYLGPDFRYSTYALADGELQDDVLYGDLILY